MQQNNLEQLLIKNAAPGWHPYLKTPERIVPYVSSAPEPWEVRGVEALCDHSLRIFTPYPRKLFLTF